MPENPISFSDLFDSTFGGGAAELLNVATSIRTLSTNYRALSRTLDGDAQKIKGALDAILASGQALRTQASAVNIMDRKSRSSIDDLSAAVSQLALDQEKYKRTLEGVESVRRTAKDGTDSLTSALREQQQALKTAFAAKDMEGARTAALRIKELKTESDELNRALRGGTSILNATQGSYRAMENEARKLDQQLKSLEGGFEGNSQEAQQLKNRLAQVNEGLLVLLQI